MTNAEGMTKSETRNVRADDSFWDDGAGLVREEPETKRVYDLEERTTRFGEAIIDFAKTILQNPVTNRLITQLVGLVLVSERTTSKPTTQFPKRTL